MKRYRARWLFPGDGPPREQAVVSVDGRRIAAVDFEPSADVIDLGDVALVPGLINAHTHLEFSHLNRPVEPLDRFAEWIRSVITERRGRPISVEQNITLGLEESVRGGATGLAEIATTNWLVDFPSMLSPARPRCLVFREILGLRAEAVHDQLNAAREFLQRARAAGWTDIGLSPHAPYSLHPDLFEGLCELAQREQVPVAMHLAESPVEMELLQTGDGPLVRLFREMGLWKEGLLPPGTRPLDYLKRLAELPRGLIIHGNLLNQQEIDFLAEHPQLSVVYCPRTHAAMQTRNHPWQVMQSHGINVTVGTDSRASNPDLGLWNELRFLKERHPELPASEVLSLATVKGSRALGWETAGRIAAGSAADLCLVGLSEDGLRDPEKNLFSRGIADVMRGGDWLWSTSDPS